LEITDLKIWGLPVLVIGIVAALRKREGSVRATWIASLILFALATFGQFRGQWLRSSEAIPAAE
jgi:hypothetical protein